MAVILQMAFQSHFVVRNGCIVIKIPLKFVFEGTNNNKQALIEAMVWCWTSDKPLFNSLAPGKFELNFRYLTLQIISVIDGWGISC